MKRMRFLLVLTTMLLSSRFVLAQVSLDLNGDYSTDPLDFAAVADAILAGEQSGSADINQDKKVDVKDITTMYNRIYNTRYFWFGNPRPYASDYTTKSGLAINKYNSISEVLAAAPTIKLDANQNGFILVPSGWDVSDVAMQDTGTGEYFALTERSTNIVNHKVYYSGKFSTAGNVTLKKTGSSVLTVTKRPLSKKARIGCSSIVWTTFFVKVLLVGQTSSGICFSAKYSTSFSS